MDKIIAFIQGSHSLEKIKKKLYLFLGVVVVLDIVISVLHLKHAVFAWDSIPGFLSIFAFASTFLIIIIPKTIGHALLMKKEDFYD